MSTTDFRNFVLFSRQRKDSDSGTEASRGKAPRVLVADDERLVADTLALILNQNGFESRAAYSGKEALELARAFRPDLALLDVIMPGIDGIEVAKRLRELAPKTRILLFSGQGGTNELLDSARSRGDSFEILAKPIAPAALLARLRELMDQQQAS